MAARARAIIYAGIAIFYMLIPLIVIAVFSFNDPAGKFNFTWQGFTLQHLGERVQPAGPERRDDSQPRAGRGVDAHRDLVLGR